jgi:hypothetical protein
MSSVPQSHEGDPRPIRLTPAAGCILSILIVAGGLVMFMAAMTLALRGELAVGRGSPGEIRLWLITDAQTQGLGLSTAQRVSTSNDATRECYVRQVKFLLWRSVEPGVGTSYCECYIRTAQGWASVGTCPSQ